MDAKSYNFALIGVAGYIAPRHLKAIIDTGNNLIAVTDPFDSVGILDRYFDNVDYFREFERFDRHVEKLRNEDLGKEIHWVSICSPNFLHDAHIRFALRVGANVICEKPLVLNPWNLDALERLEDDFGRRINNVLQLRVHPSLIALKEKVARQKKNKKYEIDLTYITGRGNWYHYSWKGDMKKSGGLAVNIGVHFFDLLAWIFGPMQDCQVHIKKDKTMAGYLELANARVRWFLSVDRDDLQHVKVEPGFTTFRSIQVDGEEVEFSKGFTALHTEIYRRSMAGEGFSVADARPSIEMVYKIRQQETVAGDREVWHPVALLKSKEK